MQNIALLGATGSIGSSALDVISRYPDRFNVQALTCGNNYKKLANLAAVWRPEVVAIAEESLYKPLMTELANAGVTTVRVEAGNDAMAAIAADSEVDTVISAIVGAVGAISTFAAVGAGKRTLIANKESIVCGGDVLMNLAKEKGATILPVDSEHNAVFQCLENAPEEERAKAKVWLTCSGGPFHAKKDIDLKTVTPAQALAHPTWNMGKKISIDSATLMNKGLEVIEAHHLFNKPAEQIGVVIHPQSIVHSMVEYADGAVIAQLGSPDMRLPISYCMGYPERLDGEVETLDFAKAMNLTFEAPDMERFPQLGLAFDAIREGGMASIVLNAANEIGVEAFLEEKIAFTDIAKLCTVMMGKITGEMPQALDDILAVDAMVREKSRAWVAKKAK
ncbi:MAG: 1-deoxy-D-xylulose-5-phosphate reductoisomerase [Sutterellaceae bacterium]|nr:1-deoxy-D-xylulose-5-phosphate reductoisomerase [Sutterellaceae bacterium]